VIALPHDPQLCGDLAAPDHAGRVRGILIEVKNGKGIGRCLGSGDPAVMGWSER
jgi:hypothetical protein